MIDTKVSCDDGYLRAVLLAAVKRHPVLFEAVERTARQLAEYPSIMLCLPNSEDWIAVFLAGILFGHYLIVLDSRIGSHELDMLIREFSPHLILCRGTCDTAYDHLDPQQLRQRPEIDVVEASGTFVLFTTGTTGKPKGVCITLSNLMVNLLALVDAYHVQAEDHSLLLLPFSHAMGMILMMMAVCYTDDYDIAYDTESLLHLLHCNEYTFMGLPPALLSSLRSQPMYLVRLARARIIISGSAGLGQEVISELRAYGIPLVNGYGMTECVAGVAVTRYNDRDCVPWVTPLPCCEIRLAADGEIWVRGPSVCSGYCDGSSIPDAQGWYHTGDAGEMLEGRLRILHRLDSVRIMQNGFKVNLEQIEAKACRLDQVHECQAILEHDTQHEWLALRVVPSAACSLAPPSLLKIINEGLSYFEKISELRLCVTLPRIGGKLNRNDKG